MAEGENPAAKPVPTPGRFAIKRSQVVSTVLVASAGLTAFGLSRIDPTPNEDVLVYPDAAACAAEGIRPADECRSEYEIARAAYPRKAPHYDTRTACEDHHGGGHCLTDPMIAVGDRRIIPRMAGYMLGRHASQGVLAEPVFEHRSGHGGHGGGYCTGSGSKIATGTGGSASAGKIKSVAVKGGSTGASGSMGKGGAASFGGFGGSGKSFSSFGS